MFGCGQTESDSNPMADMQVEFYFTNDHQRLMDLEDEMGAITQRLYQDTVEESSDSIAQWIEGFYWDGIDHLQLLDHGLLVDDPFVTNVEILSYDPETMLFELDSAAIETINAIDFQEPGSGGLRGKPFCITINGSPVVGGWVIPMHTSLYKGDVYYGVNGLRIERREQTLNTPLLMEVFDAQGKLK